MMSYPNIFGPRRGPAYPQNMPGKKSGTSGGVFIIHRNFNRFLRGPNLTNDFDN